LFALLAVALTSPLLADVARDAGDARQQYFSPLLAINTQTVSRLGLAWAYDLGTRRGQEATPVVVDGVMYTSGYIGIVYALDAATGKERWRFTPTIDTMFMRHACCDAVNRGVSVAEGKVFVASIDGRLHALDAATGKEVWSVDTIIDHALGYSSSGAPIIAHDVVVIGNSGGDMGHGGVRGYVSGFDLTGGALKWRFYTVPPAPGRAPEHPELKRAARSWDPHRSSAYPGGAAVWDGMAYDPKLNQLYFGTGNAAPWDVRKLGPHNGDELYACSIVALNPDTGRMSWFYQTTPGDRWDFDATQKLVLADMKIDGRQRYVLMQANKNGFFYVLDRSTGELISAEKFSYVTWASSVDRKSGRPLVTAQADYYDTPKNLYPSAAGAHSWQPMSFSPATQLVYIPVIDMSNVWLNMEGSGGRIHYINGSFTILPLFPDDTYDAAALKPLFGLVPDLKTIQGERKGELIRELIRAWNPVTKKIVWEHETSSARRGYDGGILSTGGNLVFQGRGDGDLVVYAADTGATLKAFQTGSHIMAAPMSYEINGIQYVAVQTGYGGAAMTIAPIPPTSAAFKYDNENRLLVFKLDGGAVPLPATRGVEPFPPPPVRTSTATQIQHGEDMFTEQCARCHVFGPSVTPDLRKLTPVLHEAFNAIVLDGLFAPQGMEKFGDLLSAADVDAIHAYLIDQQSQGYAVQPHE
jgi:quinohemoprotein ethanol dehydrogenase